jgi:glycosyltransferase involved in cell wall biosynthesis
MKIGLVTGEYPPMKGGVGDYTRSIAVYLRERGHSVRVITDQRCIQPNINSGAPHVYALVSGRWSWMDLWRVRRASTDLDIVNIQYQAAAYGGMRPPVHFLPQITVPPTAVTFHDLLPPYLFPKAGWLRERAIWGLSRGAAGVVLTNAEDYLRCRAQEGHPPLAEVPIGSNIPCAPPDTFSALAWRVARGIDAADEFLLGYFGFMSASKGVETLMYVVAALHAAGLPVRLVLIGDQSGSSDSTNTAYAKSANNLAKELGIDSHILHTGYLSLTEASAAILSCDLMVMPYRDGVSFRRGSFLACLAHGRATVTTRPAVRLAGLRDRENVILTRPETGAIVTAVQELHSNPALRKNIETGALRLSTQFEWPHIAERLETFFVEVLNRYKD